MNTSDYKAGFTDVIKNYIVLEKQVNAYLTMTTRHYCCNCRNRCCREDICRETIDSAFLRILVEKQHIKYNHKNGWMGTDGCKLDYGRPPICYEFFCKTIIDDDKFKLTGAEKLIKMFVSVGNRAYGNQHLVSIPSIEKLSTKKIDKIIDNIVKATRQISNTQRN